MLRVVTGLSQEMSYKKETDVTLSRAELEKLEYHPAGPVRGSSISDATARK